MTRWFTKPWSFQKDNGVTLLTEGSMSYQQLSPLFTTVAGWTSVLVQLDRHRWKSKREGDHDCGEVSHGPSSQKPFRPINRLVQLLNRMCVIRPLQCQGFTVRNPPTFPDCLHQLVERNPVVLDRLKHSGPSPLPFQVNYLLDRSW
jgi:hypothetical protein